MPGIRMFVDEGLGHSSYLIDLGNGTAAILDPPRFPTEHLSAATSQGLEPRWTMDTHSHADYVTGSPSLTAQSGLTFVAPAASQLATPHQPIHDDESIELAAGVSLRAMSVFLESLQPARMSAAENAQNEALIISRGADRWNKVGPDTKANPSRTFGYETGLGNQA